MLLGKSFTTHMCLSGAHNLYPDEHIFIQNEFSKSQTLIL